MRRSYKRKSKRCLQYKNKTWSSLKSRRNSRRNPWTDECLLDNKMGLRASNVVPFEQVYLVEQTVISDDYPELTEPNGNRCSQSNLFLYLQIE